MKDILHENFIGFDISITGEYFILHGLICKNEVNFYLSIFRVKISLNEEMVDKVEDFIYTLLIF